MDWEAIRRAVNRCKAGDSFTASWTSFLGGLFVTFLISLITIRYTVATHLNPYSSIQVFFGVSGFFSGLGAILMFATERRALANRSEFLAALHEELDAAERYMAEAAKQ